MEPDRCPHGHEHTMQCEDCATDRLRQAAAERRIERSLGSLGDRALVEEVTRLRAKVEELRGVLRRVDRARRADLSEYTWCPWCGVSENTEPVKHKSSCRLAAALNDARKGEGE